jgi:hypothetical protein
VVRDDKLGRHAWRFLVDQPLIDQPLIVPLPSFFDLCRSSRRFSKANNNFILTVEQINSIRQSSILRCGKTSYSNSDRDAM